MKYTTVRIGEDSRQIARRSGWRHFASVAGDVFEVAAAVVLAPFRLLAAIWRFGVRTTLAVYNGLFFGFLGLFGLGLTAWVGFALYRVLLYPIFHHH